jgi:hypothetical protein
LGLWAIAYVHIPTEKRKKGEKFIARARKGYLVGYDDGLNYRVWFPNTTEVVKSADVKFDESPSDQILSSADTAAPTYNAMSDMVEINLPTAEALIEDGTVHSRQPTEILSDTVFVPSEESPCSRGHQRGSHCS